VDRREFELLRDLPGKRIAEDIRFVVTQSTSPNLTFSNVEVENNRGIVLRLNGTYKPGIPSISFNFTTPEGPICRLDVNSTIHKTAGRTHKHDLRDDADPRQNLPHADAAPDFANLTPPEVWKLLCDRANIEHDGTFHDPSEGLP
jgi:hypothetical protein